MTFNINQIEEKWQKRWESEKTYRIDVTGNIVKKLYSLVMFIYPSSDRLHIGHWFNYGPTDTWARFKKLQGFTVFEPMGYDAFGLPAENAAVKTGVHPEESTRRNIDDIRIQLKRIGAMYDWEYEIDTSNPEYYKWTQWLFLQLYKMKKAYRTKAPVNWCPNDQTVLANEQVVEGACERCGTPVVKKDLVQWFFKITDYAEELLQGLVKLDWPERTKTMQRNWIGKSKGLDVTFEVDGREDKFNVFTTRPDTLFGVTYMVLAPEHPLVDKITTREYRDEVNKYVAESRNKSEIERQSLDKEKTGVFTGAYAVNPVNQEKIPVWCADYVLYGYGTGAVMAVPGHDQRDFEFARKFYLPIRKVILKPDTNEKDELEEAYIDPGIMINSGSYNGMKSEEGIEKISDDLETEGTGKRRVNYRMRDWLVSRQRYWGAPIPIIYCEKCGEVPVPEEQLPVLLPENADFRPGGESPLARSSQFIVTNCPLCQNQAKRDVDTMDTFVDSSWYFLRFPSANIQNVPFDPDITAKFLPVDKYVGGAEHAVMHLLYARFITKVLNDAGYIDFDEPFLSLVHQGTITNAGAKMSKSKGNVVNPDIFVEEYGSDVFRMYLMFMGPYEEGGDWSDTGIVGIDRFIKRLYHLVRERSESIRSINNNGQITISQLKGEALNLYKKCHRTLKKVTDDTEKFQFNTAIAAMMEFLNELVSYKDRNDDQVRLVFAHSVKYFIVMISPYAPHVAEEMWEMTGNSDIIFSTAAWPGIDNAALTTEEVTIVAQINGKVRGKFIVPSGMAEDELKNLVLHDDKIKKYLADKEIQRLIVVKDKLINVVVR